MSCLHLSPQRTGHQWSLPTEVGPVAFLGLTIALFVVIPWINNGTIVGDFDFFNGLQTFATTGLLAIGLALTMIIGEFDLSVIGSYAFGGLVAVQAGQDHPILGLVSGVAAGLVAGLIQGAIVARLGISSVPVTLGGLLLLLGLTYHLSDGKNVSFEDIGFGLKLDDQVLGIFSIRSGVTILVAALLVVVLAWTATGRLFRAIGGDREASRTVGLPVTGVVLAAFSLSGALSALGGAMSAFALASAQPSIGFAPLTFGVTAALIGGVTLSGGRGSIVGVTAAAAALSLIQGVFQVLVLPVYYTDVIMGALLVFVAGTQAPGMRAQIAAANARRFSRGLLAPSEPDAEAAVVTGRSTT